MKDSARITELEIKFAYLEKHVQEQDAAIYAQQKKIDALEKAVRALYARAENGAPEDAPANEKPPHY